MASRWRKTGSRLFLWSYALGIVAFYTALFRRTSVGRGAASGSKPVALYGHRPAGAWPLVSIIVPARNEERNIRDCVASLLAQEYPRCEVMVVDDASTDDTPRILAEMQQAQRAGPPLVVRHVERLPEGWAGKPHALHMGAEAARGEWLLFTDADTRHAPAALRTAVQTAQARDLDLLSYGTTQDLPDFWGRVLMPLAYMGISMQYPVAQVNDPRSPVAIANGQYILLRKELYDRIGGYAAPELRATVLDDRDLAAAVKRARGRLALVDGRTLVQTRMYSGLREHWDGWSKNAYAGSRGGPLFYLVMILGLPLSCIAPFALLLAGLVTRRGGWTAAGAVSVAAVLGYRSRLNAEMRLPWRYVWTHPLAAGVFTGILARSFWRKVSGRGVTWRGRTIQV